MIEIDKNLKERLKLWEMGDRNVGDREMIMKLCKEDIGYWVNNFIWTYDPRLEEGVIPFILYPRQEKLIMELERSLNLTRGGSKVNMLLDKPRGVGATWAIMVWILHHWLFDDFSVRVGSRKEDYVDKRGEPDTLFSKFDFVLDRLPRWMLPIGFDMGRHRSSMLLVNPKNGNSISGESANINFGRGGRKSVIVFDELAFWEWAKSSWESAGEATNFRLAMSTPPENGRDSHWYKLLKGVRGEVKVFEFDWRDVPTRDEKWLREQRLSKSEEEFAREVLKSFEGTTEGKVYAKDLILADIGEYKYNPKLPLFVSWDYGLDGVGLIWYQKNFELDKVYIIDSYYNFDKVIDFYFPFITGVVVSGLFEYTEEELKKIKEHKEWRRDIIHYGDPDVKKRDLKSGERLVDYLYNRGIYIQHEEWNGRTWLDLREKTKLLFQRLCIDENKNETLLSALRNAKYPKRRENSQAIGAPKKPIHDWSSHLRSSLEYFADNEPEFNPIQSVEEIRQMAAQEAKFNKYDII